MATQFDQESNLPVCDHQNHRTRVPPSSLVSTNDIAMLRREQLSDKLHEFEQFFDSYGARLKRMIDAGIEVEANAKA
jgi:hypothetical protein